MNNIYKFCLAIALVFSLTVSGFAQKSTKYKFVLQMNNYVGEGAYIVVSLIDANGAYEKTLYVMGSDKKWYPDFKEWHKFYKKKTTDISAITGASVTGGDRSVAFIEIENAKINKGYRLRFESAVEDKGYHVKDAEVPLTTEGLASKTEGTGFIKNIRFSAN